MNKKEILEEFEKNVELAEMRAISKISLERPLTDKEHKRFLELGRKNLYTQA